MTFTDAMEAIAMISSEEEEIILEDVIDTAAARGQVEKWLLELEIDMKKSVKAQVNQMHKQCFYISIQIITLIITSR